MYCHIAALAVAKVLHAELVIPVAYTLDSNGNYTAFDTRSILDVTRMRASWARAGMTLHVVRVHTPLHTGVHDVVDPNRHPPVV